MSPQTSLDMVYLYCDGASRGNPGKAAIAYIIRDEDGITLKTDNMQIGITTNNTAEYRAIIAGLNACKKFTKTKVIVTSDSSLAINQLNNRWRINKDHLKELYKEVKKIEEHFNKVVYVQKPRSDPDLVEADQLANEALDDL